MKNILTTIAILMLMTIASAELININPDPNGEFWIVGGYSTPTPEQQAIIDAIPQLALPDSYSTNPELPYKIDNTEEQYFRPIFSQEYWGSCLASSRVGYTYTYEQNFENGTSASIEENQYPTHYTFNLQLNQTEKEVETEYPYPDFSCNDWKIINAGGIPNVSTYGGLWPDEIDNPIDPDWTDDELNAYLSRNEKLWMTGYEKYLSGMNNRILREYRIPVNTPEELIVLKQWMNDHLDGSSAGGIVNFAAGIGFGNYKQVKLPRGTECADEWVVTSWDSINGHAMTFVGYNDSIRYDFNGDGKFTNDLDITGDRVVDMKDWEIGGLKMANSWGNTWGDNGFSWVMYRTLALNYTEGGIYSNTVHCIRACKYYKPTLKLKAKINYSKRNQIKIWAGIADSLSAAVPSISIDFPYFNFTGGSIGMSGNENNDNNIEIGLDISALLDLASINSNKTIFLGVQQETPDGGTQGGGYIEEMAIYDEQDNLINQNSDSIGISENTFNYVAVNMSFLPKTLYINNATGNDYNNGLTPATAYRSISKAIETAGAGATINLAAGTYTLSSAEEFGVVESGLKSGLNITKSLTIRGVSPENTIIQANYNPNDCSYRVFYINGGNIQNNVDVNLENLTMQNGVGEPGGGIRAELVHLLKINNCVVKNNYNSNDLSFIGANGGGGISMTVSNLEINNSVISGNINNTSICGGSGIYCFLNGSEQITIKNSAIINNNSVKEGGGCFFEFYLSDEIGHHILIENSTISSNYSSSGLGHGLYFNSPMGNSNVKINCCTIANNYNSSSPDTGYGIYINSNVTNYDIRNSIIANNATNYAGPMTSSFFTRTYTISDDASLPFGEVGNSFNNLNLTDPETPLITGIKPEFGTSFYKVEPDSPAKDAIPPANYFNGAGYPLLDANGDPLHDEDGNEIVICNDQLGNPVFNQNRDIGSYESPYYWINATSTNGGYESTEDSTITLQHADSLETWEDYMYAQPDGSITLTDGTVVDRKDGSYFTLFDTAGLKVEGNARIVNCTIGAPNVLIDINNNFSLTIEKCNLTIHPDTILKLGVGSSLIVENGSNLVFEDGAVIELAEDSEIRVMNGGRLVTNNNTSEKITFKNNTSLWYSIIGEIGSTIEIADTEIIGAEFGFCGTPKICSITNSRFIDCDNGLSLIKLPDDTTENNSFTINNNYFYGKGIGTGITLTYCTDPIEGNSVYNFEEGVKLVSSSITLAKNKIVNNINNGLYVTGHGSKPVLVNSLTKDAAPELRSFNNEIRDNCLNNPYYNGAQIYLSYSAGVYMTGGCNNVFSGEIGTFPTVPCIKGIINISPDPTVNKVTIAAERNYWGYESIDSLNQSIFFDLPHTKPIDGEIETGYFIDYEPYGEKPFVEGGIYPISDFSSNEPRSNESILLFNAMKLEQSDNLKPSIKLYEQIIKKYPDTPEYFVAITRLPELYIVDERSLEPLISSYDEALATENISVKKFFKEMKVSTHIKGKNYDTAIALAEEMMAEAEGEDEILLSEIDISIASMLKEEKSGRKGRQSNYSDNLNKLLSKLNGTESKEEPAGLTENVMLPKESTLYQNYPNPFNPVTQIKFDLSETANVKLSVYNVSGQLVSELANGVMNAGNHAVDFDGSKLNSGVYYYTLNTDGKNITKKMVLTK